MGFRGEGACVRVCGCLSDCEIALTRLWLHARARVFVCGCGCVCARVRGWCSPQQQSYFDFEFDESQAASLPAASTEECEMMLLQPRAAQGLHLTASTSPSEDDQPQSNGKRKRCATEPAKQGKARGMRRSVSFSKSSMIRMTEIIAEPTSPVPVELKTDHEAAMRNEDGPRPAATLLDDLIVVSACRLPRKVARAVLVPFGTSCKPFGSKTHHNFLLRQY